MPGFFYHASMGVCQYFFIAAQGYAPLFSSYSWFRGCVFQGLKGFVMYRLDFSLYQHVRTSKSMSQKKFALGACFMCFSVSQVIFLVWLSRSRDLFRFSSLFVESFL